MQVNSKLRSASRNQEEASSVIQPDLDYSKFQHLSFDVRNKKQPHLQEPLQNQSSNIFSPEKQSIRQFDNVIDQDQEVSHNFVLRIGSPSIVSYEMIGGKKVGDYTGFSRSPNLKQNAKLNLQKMKEKMNNYAGQEGTTTGSSSLAHNMSSTTTNPASKNQSALFQNRQTVQSVKSITTTAQHAAIVSDCFSINDKVDIFVSEKGATQLPKESTTSVCIPKDGFNISNEGQSRQILHGLASESLKNVFQSPLNINRPPELQKPEVIRVIGPEEYSPSSIAIFSKQSKSAALKSGASSRPMTQQMGRRRGKSSGGMWNNLRESSVEIPKSQQGSRKMKKEISQYLGSRQNQGSRSRKRQLLPPSTGPTFLEQAQSRKPPRTGCKVSGSTSRAMGTILNLPEQQLPSKNLISNSSQATGLINFPTASSKAIESRIANSRKVPSSHSSKRKIPERPTDFKRYLEQIGDQSINQSHRLSPNRICVAPISSELSQVSSLFSPSSMVPPGQRAQQAQSQLLEEPSVKPEDQIDIFKQSRKVPVNYKQFSRQSPNEKIKNSLKNQIENLRRMQEQKRRNLSLARTAGARPPADDYRPRTQVTSPLAQQAPGEKESVVLQESHSMVEKIPQRGPPPGSFVKKFMITSPNSSNQMIQIPSSIERSSTPSNCLLRVNVVSPSSASQNKAKQIQQKQEIERKKQIVTQYHQAKTTAKKEFFKNLEIQRGIFSKSQQVKVLEKKIAEEKIEKQQRQSKEVFKQSLFSKLRKKVDSEKGHIIEVEQEKEKNRLRIKKGSELSTSVVPSRIVTSVHSQRSTEVHDLHLFLQNLDEQIREKASRRELAAEAKTEFIDHFEIDKNRIYKDRKMKTDEVEMEIVKALLPASKPAKISQETWEDLFRGQLDFLSKEAKAELMKRFDGSVHYWNSMIGNLTQERQVNLPAAQQEASQPSLDSATRERINVELDIANDALEDEDRGSQRFDHMLSSQILTTESQFMFTDADDVVEQKQIKKYGKLRYLIAKHFLSKDLDEIIEEQNMSTFQKLDIFALTRIIMFQNALSEAFQTSTHKNFSLGQKYQYLNSNLFRNFYRRDRQYSLMDISIFEDLNSEFAQLQSNQGHLYDLNKLFFDRILKENFYRLAATKELAGDHSELDQSMTEYSQILKANRELVKPFFLTIFCSRSLFLRETTISHGQALSLSAFLVAQKDHPNFQVRQLVIDSCQCADDDLAVLLDGLRNQGVLARLVINNCTIGLKSLEAIHQLIPSLFEFRFHNVFGLDKMAISTTIKKISVHCKQLQVLQMNYINMNSDWCIDQLCTLIQNEKYFHTLELSHSSLEAKNMYKISQQLKICTQNLKVLNLSYNYLIRNIIKYQREQRERNETEEVQLFTMYSKLRMMQTAFSKMCLNNLKEEEYALLFMDNINEFLSVSDMLHHLDLSGLQLKMISPLKTKTLVQKINECSNLVAVHLSDNGIVVDWDKVETNKSSDAMADFVYYQDILHIVGLNYNDVNNTKNDQTFGDLMSSEKAHFSFESMSHISKFRTEMNYGAVIREAYLGSFEFKSRDDEDEVSLLSQQGRVSPVVQMFLEKRKRELVKFERDLNNIKELKYQLILEAQLSSIHQNMALNESKLFGGIGASRPAFSLVSVDQLILNRYCCNPELVFNQDYKKEMHTVHEIDRCFDMDDPFKWRFSKTAKESNLQQGCYVCQKYPYSLIFFDQKEIENNKGLVEIKNQVHLKHIQRECKNYSAKLNQSGLKTPIIFGTVVNQDHTATKSKAPGSSQVSFGRKIQMLRAEYFTLLSVCQTIKFVRRKKHFKQIRDGLMVLLQLEDDELIKTGKLKKVNNILKNSGLLYKLNGWKEILSDKACKNELVDIKRINFLERLNEQLTAKFYQSEEGKSGQPMSDIYIYGAYLKPGFHQFIIYCPLTKRAFCKEVVIDLHNQDTCYPELPKQIGAKNIQRKIPNVWAQWKETTGKSKMEAISFYTRPENCRIEQQIPRTDSFTTDLTACLTVLQENFDIIAHIEKEMMISSSCAPGISMKSFLDFFEKMNDIHIKAKETHKQLTRAQYTSIYQASISSSGESTTRRPSELRMNRPQLIEAIVRISQKVFLEKFPQINLRLTFKLFLKPICDKAEIIISRKQFRNSEKLSWLIFDNQQQLQRIYNDYVKYDGVGFTLAMAEKLLNSVGVQKPQKEKPTFWKVTRAAIATAKIGKQIVEKKTSDLTLTSQPSMQAPSQQQTNQITPRGLLSNRSGRSVQPQVRKESVKGGPPIKKQDTNFLNLDAIQQQDLGPQDYIEMALAAQKRISPRKPASIKMKPSSARLKKAVQIMKNFGVKVVKNDLFHLIDEPAMRTCFFFSQGPVLREDKEQNAFMTLSFVEFQEFLCRASHIINLPPTKEEQGEFGQQQTLPGANPFARKPTIKKRKISGSEAKLYRLLKVLFERRYKMELNTPADLPLKPIVSFDDDSEED